MDSRCPGNFANSPTHLLRFDFLKLEWGVRSHHLHMLPCSSSCFRRILTPRLREQLNPTVHVSWNTLVTKPILENLGLGLDNPVKIVFQFQDKQLIFEWHSWNLGCISYALRISCCHKPTIFGSHIHSPWWLLSLSWKTRWTGRLRSKFVGGGKW
jgi:hypothetical protein